MKKFLKKIVASYSWRYVVRLRQKHDFIVVGVSGSVGKSGTKRAIAITLSQFFRVRWQDGNYNDIVSVPLIFFGLSMPSLFNPFAWLATFRQMRKRIDHYPFDVVVIELGTDGPNQLKEFGKFITLDLSIVTRLVPEHMEFFADLQDVAKEELSVQEYSKAMIVHESIVSDFGSLLRRQVQTYGVTPNAAVRFHYNAPDLLIETKSSKLRCRPKLIGDHQMWGLAAAAAAGWHLGMKSQDIQNGIGAVEPMPGRMQLLDGIKGSTIIDDTYNSSPEAVEAALDTLMSFPAKKRIAVLGNMNELGSMSEEAHRAIGEYIDSKVDCLLTIGPDANSHLADAAATSGIDVLRFESPVSIGEKLSQIVENGTVVLLKGSQNGVFLEEAIKPILLHRREESQLVRQSPEWMAKKASLLKK